MSTRGFSGSGDVPKPPRTLEDAPAGMRVEFVDVAFRLAEQAEAWNDTPTSEDLYQIVVQTLGIVDPAVQPYGGLRLRTQRYLISAEWTRFYDVVLRLVSAFGVRRLRDYRAGVNALFAAHGVAWDLTQTGKLERVLPSPLASGITATLDDLRTPGYQSALQLFTMAKDHFDARPRRDRDAATNAFDAAEAAGKIRFGLTTGTFGDVLNEVRRQNALNEDVQQIVKKLEVLRHHHLGHGGADPFNLTPNEVDFVYVVSAAAARLFVRL